jgi:hypothetical protein
LPLTAQDINLKGKLISKDSLNIKDMHVINKSKKTISITDNYGNYSIEAEIGDTIILNSLNFERKTIIVDAPYLEQNKTLVLREKTIELDPVDLNRKSIFSRDKDIYVPGEFVDEKTLKLPNVNKKQKLVDEKDRYTNLKDAKVPITAVITTDLEKMYRYFSGESQRELELLKVQQADELTRIMKNDLGAYFFLNILDLDREEIDPFINFCGKKDLLDLYVKNNVLNLVEYMLNKNQEFKKISIEEIYE